MTAANVSHIGASACLCALSAVLTGTGQRNEVKAKQMSGRGGVDRRRPLGLGCMAGHADMDARRKGLRVGEPRSAAEL
jgi:hypothetical protein